MARSDNSPNPLSAVESSDQQSEPLEKALSGTKCGDWTVQTQLLQRRLQQALPDMDVRSHPPFSWDSPAFTPGPVNPTPLNLAVKPRPTIAICAAQPPHSIAWALDIDASQPMLFAQQGIPEYWSLNTHQVELRTYQQPTAEGYQHQRLFCVGDRISPSAFSRLTLQVQEPLPLHFVTRTATGQRTCPFVCLPLKLLSGEISGGISGDGLSEPVFNP